MRNTSVESVVNPYFCIFRSQHVFQFSRMVYDVPESGDIDLRTSRCSPNDARWNNYGIRVRWNMHMSWYKLEHALDIVR